jgi:two-component sensor histidine kinase
MRDASGQIAKIQCIVEDITDHKKAEEILRQSLHEKGSSAQRVHQGEEQPADSIEPLKTSVWMPHVRSPSMPSRRSQNRIRSMALVHENLYRSDSLARVDFKEYMNSLICFLMTSFGKKSSHIGLKLDLDQVFLSVDQAIPCGLIANELISNCVKHAFPGGIKGQIRICLKSLDGGMVSFSVRDNGIGLPSGWKISGTETMGLKLVTALINQLKGTIDVISSHEVDGSHGSEFKISFDAQH